MVGQTTQTILKHFEKSGPNMCDIRNIRAMYMILHNNVKRYGSISGGDKYRGSRGVPAEVAKVTFFKEPGRKCHFF